MDSGKQVREIFSEYTKCIDVELQTVFDTQTELTMYKHLGYFMGFYDEELNPVTTYGGKRFRSGLSLMLADWYGARESGVSVATSIELFHNFTLIHDDIVDEDTLRRGRPTVWKLFGTDHAINSGDAQLVLSLQVVGESEILSSEQKVAVNTFLTRQYLKVIEGQYLDFTLTEALLGDSAVTKDAYLTMVTKKTADLIAAATTVSGIVSGKSEEECEALFAYGYNLGIAYQLCDDVLSIWGTQGQTGKRAHGDILEKKRTMPILYLFEKGTTDTKQTLLHLYNRSAHMTEPDVQTVITLLEENDVYQYMCTEIEKRAIDAKEAAQKLSLTQAQKDTLQDIVDQLLPDIKNI